MLVFIKVLFLLVSVFYFIFEGKREAMYFHFKMQRTQTNLNEHSIFTIQRSLYFLILFFGFYLQLDNALNSLLFVISLMLMFPYFHDGMYYLIRNKLNIFIYKKKWKDNSTTSTAIFEITYQTRLLMFLFGLICYLFLILKSCIVF